MICSTHTVSEPTPRIGIGAGKSFDPSKLTPEMKTAFEQGRADAYAASPEA